MFHKILVIGQPSSVDALYKDLETASNRQMQPTKASSFQCQGVALRIDEDTYQFQQYLKKTNPIEQLAQFSSAELCIAADNHNDTLTHLMDIAKKGIPLLCYAPDINIYAEMTERLSPVSASVPTTIITIDRSLLDIATNAISASASKATDAISASAAAAISEVGLFPARIRVATASTPPSPDVFDASTDMHL